MDTGLWNVAPIGSRDNRGESYLERELHHTLYELLVLAWTLKEV
jgi:hypothetical protein